MKVLYKFIAWFERVVERNSLVPTTPFLPTDLFPWIADVEASYPRIRKELDGVLERKHDLPNFQDISIDQEELTKDDRWKTYFFFGYGFKAKGNCRRCPETTRALRKIPGLTTAFYSILEPEKKIPPHRGPYKGVLRYHLGLKIPTPSSSCGIRVADEARHWEAGEGLVFDDSYVHEAWNYSDDVRVVLFVDFVRPLRWPVSWMNRIIIKLIGATPFVRDVRKRQTAWEERFALLLKREDGQPEGS